jgi:quinoprotein glucose dehydrogenase
LIRAVLLTLGTGALACEPAAAPAAQTAAVDWSAYGRDAGGSRFSPAAQITRDNVAALQVAWIYRTGDWIPGRTRFEATPLLVDGTLYVSTPLGRVIALDPATGSERWAFDPNIDLSGSYGDFANRGVAFWRELRAAPVPSCGRRVFVAPIDGRLIALDAGTGRRCADFGSNGEIDLKRDLVNPPFELGEYQITSPPAIAGDLVIVGSSIGDNNRFDTPSGIVRAFDARTGAQRWAWDPIPRRAGQPGYETWRGSRAHRTGSANVWTVISVDTAADLVFLPTGSAAPDFYGGERLGQNLFANSLVALRASTGEYVWHFQAVHHDLWDYDLPAQPALVSIRRGDRDIPAVVIVSKMGHLFLLDRLTGEALLPVEERAVPKSDVAGEEASPTQPVPVRPPPLAPQHWSENPALSAPDREWCRAQLAGVRHEGIFTPPSLAGSLLYPGNIGGSNWSGVAVHPTRAWAVTPTNRLATIVRLVPRASFDSVSRANDGWQSTPQRGTAYGMMRRQLVTPRRTFCNAPPWGALTAVDLSSGDIKWEVPLGDSTGALNLGGAMITAGGLVFAAGTPDRRLRAFDFETGRMLAQWSLPAAGNAMPMTYVLDNGQQYVVIAAGGRPPLWPQGDHVVAFTLRGAALPAPPAGRYFGEWTGELLLEENRLPVRITLQRSSERAIVGTFTITAPRVQGTVTASLVGSRLEVRIPFDNTDEQCSGVAQGSLELANAGALLVGELGLTGGCSDGEERGALAVRRP